MDINKNGLLLVISGPSGCGKGTVVSEILSKSSDYSLSVSMTTRPPRINEIDGKHYYFVSKAQFEQNIKENKMLEYATYCDNYYGTPAQAVEDMLSKGKNVILEIEMVGAMKVRKICKDAVSVLLLPPSFEVLENRLRSRATNSEDDILKRLEKAKSEIMEFSDYDYVVINQDGGVEESAAQIMKIAEVEKQRTSRNEHIKNNFCK